MPGRGVEDAVSCRRLDEFGAGVLPLEDRKKGLNIEAIEGSALGERRLFMTDVKSLIVEPDIRFYRDTAS